MFLMLQARPLTLSRGCPHLVGDWDGQPKPCPLALRYPGEGTVDLKGTLGGHSLKYVAPGSMVE